MDKTEARSLLESELEKYKNSSYQELATLIGDVDAYQVAGPSEEEYNIEILVFWDDRPQGDLKIIGSIDDGRLPGAMLPLTIALEMGPDGKILE